MAEAAPQDLIEIIGDEFVRNAPPDWVTGTIEYLAVGKTDQAKARALDGSGTYLGGRATARMMQALDGLRAAMARPGKGTWFSAWITLEPTGRVVMDLDYENEPRFTAPISQGHYLEEWEAYPRSLESTPTWLAERLEQARAQHR